jgi:hypothetical protein
MPVVDTRSLKGLRRIRCGMPENAEEDDGRRRRVFTRRNRYVTVFHHGADPREHGGRAR